MNTSALLRRWITRALTAAEGRAVPLEVARAVWDEHEQTIRSEGDLVLTWQLDLRDQAAAMERVGLLREVAGSWELTEPGSRPERTVAGWEPSELAVMAQAYVAMLRDEGDGRPVHRADVIASVLARTGREEHEVARIFSNIAHVLLALGHQPLNHWPPRSNVPTGVRAAVESALPG